VALTCCSHSAFLEEKSEKNDQQNNNWVSREHEIDGWRSNEKKSMERSN
jgi:hypothetical protein